MYEIYSKDEDKVIQESKCHMITRHKSSKDPTTAPRFYKLRSLSHDLNRLVSSEEVSRCSSQKDEEDGCDDKSSSVSSILQDLIDDKPSPPQQILITPKPVRVPTPRRLLTPAKPKTPASRPRAETVETEPPLYQTNTRELPDNLKVEYVVPDPREKLTKKYKKKNTAQFDRRKVEFRLYNEDDLFLSSMKNLELMYQDSQRQMCEMLNEDRSKVQDEDVETDEEVMSKNIKDVQRELKKSILDFVGQGSVKTCLKQKKELVCNFSNRALYRGRIGDL